MPGERTDGRWARFTHERLGLSIEHPEGWDVYPDAMACVVVILEPMTEPRFRANLNVTVEPVGSPAQAAEQAAARAAAILTDLEITQRSDVHVGEAPAIATRVSFKQGSLDMRCDQWHVDAGGVVVTVSAAAPTDDFLRLGNVFERMAMSLRGPGTIEVG